MINKTKLGAAIVLALSTSYAGAASLFNNDDDIVGEVDVFTIFDADKDGKISMEEITTGIYGMISNDANGDHYLSPEELSDKDSGSHFMTNFDFQGLDKNGDGMIAASELPPKMLSIIMASDANGDHMVTEEELKTTEDYSEFAANFKFDFFDANNDGKLSAGELPPILLDQVMKSDRNDDHFVTKSELKYQVRGFY